MIYQYWVVRYVPDVVRGEFTNVGIVCGADGADWAVEFVTPSAAGASDLVRGLRDLRPWVAWFRRRIEGYPSRQFERDEVSVGWLEHIRARQANAIQFSERAPVEADSAAEAINLLFPLLVERSSVARPLAAATRTSIRRQIREALVSRRGYVLDRDLFERPRIHVGRQRGTFDLARYRSEETVLTNTWAFNVDRVDKLERELQSWNYLVSRIRREGADVRLLPSQDRHVPAGLPIEVVFDPPTSHGAESRRFEVFEAAREAWELNEVNARPLDDFLSALPGGTPSLSR